MGKILIIKGADFSKVAVDKQQDTDEHKVYIEISNAVFVKGYSSMCKANAFIPTVRSVRGSILVPKSNVLIPTPWTQTSGTAPDGFPVATDVISNYGMIALPKGAKSVKFHSTTPGYYFGMCIWGSESGFIYDSGWKECGTSGYIFKSLDGYESEDLWLTSTFKKGSSGTDEMDDLSKGDLGWYAEVEY